MITRRWMLKLGALFGGSVVAGCGSEVVSGDVDAGKSDAAPDAQSQICGYGYGAYGYGYGYGYGPGGSFGRGYGYGYGCYGYGAKWSSSLFRDRQILRFGPRDARDLARG